MKPSTLSALVLSAFCSFAFVTQGQAQEFVAGEALFLDAMPGSLHDTMKEMSRTYKAIKSQADEPKLNSDSAAKADQLAALIVHSKNFTPKGVDKKGKARYDQMLDQTAETARKLAKAFRANDNASAKKLIEELNMEKKAGHGEFE